MRFKAKMRNDQLSVLLSVVAPISKLQDPHRLAVVYLDEDYVRISCKTSEQAGITCFAELAKTHLFVEHRIESAADNVIVCQVDLWSFKLALQSVVQSRSGGGGGGGSFGGGAGKKRRHSGGDLPHTHEQQQQPPSATAYMSNNQPDVVLKLAKRNNLPCLCLEGHAVKGMSEALGDSIEIHQAIPVRILRRADMQNHLPPQINHPNVQLELPLDRQIRPVIDKLKGMGQYVLLEGTMNGELTIRLDHDGASMACFYQNLVPRWQEEEGQDQDLEKNNANSSCRLKVDAHKLSTCLQWQQHQLPMTSCLLGMVFNEMLVLHILLHPEQVGFFTYYLPVHFLQEEDEY